MDNTVLVSNNDRPSDRSSHSAPIRFKNFFSKASTFSSHPFGQSLAQFGLPREIEEVILAAWKPKTAAKYKSFIDRWELFCIRGSKNCYTPSVNSALYYLYKNGCYYSGLSSTRSALSTIVHIEGYSKLSDHLLISKFMKDVYNQHPNHPVMSIFGTLIYCWLILSPNQLILNSL